MMRHRYLRYPAYPAVIGTKPLNLPDAIDQMLREYDWNRWFQTIYWPENEPRILRMIQAANPLISSERQRILEIGCGSGYIAALFRLLGHDVTAVDAYEDPRRTEMFAKYSIPFQMTNLNDPEPLHEFESTSFDIVLLGEVFEHILNTPVGLLHHIHRLLRPDGMLILTTPNPSTIANAIRVLWDCNATWGTNHFLRETKVADGRIIDRGDIHYHEYPAWMVRDLLLEVGFSTSTPEYLTAGVAPNQPFWKRGLKRALIFSQLTRWRLLGGGFLLVARKPRGND